MVSDGQQEVVVALRGVAAGEQSFLSAGDRLLAPAHQITTGAPFITTGAPFI
jgi:hypothetical protein